MSAIKHHMIIRDEEGTPLISTKRKVGATITDRDLFDQRVAEADAAIDREEAKNEPHTVYVIAGILAAALTLTIACVLITWLCIHIFK